MASKSLSLVVGVTGRYYDTLRLTIALSVCPSLFFLFDKGRRARYISSVPVRSSACKNRTHDCLRYTTTPCSPFVTSVGEF